ncbi:MAG: hypothetical protein J2P30_16735 [Actinobacteria bacterium]|nr:hypothetical protein [Actinomycetota bacterium]
MAPFTATGTGWLARVVRGLWPDRNPLRRRTDRVEAAITACLLALFLGGSSLGAVTAGRAMYRYASGVQHAQQVAWQQSRAVLLASAPAGVPDGGIWLKARWNTPAGALRTGEILAPPGARAGTSITVWVDAAGRITDAPLRHFQVTDEAVLVAVIAPFALGLVLLVAGSLARRMLDRRRLAAWEADWGATGPQWTSHR